jgi:hypothetical protein
MVLALGKESSMRVERREFIKSVGIGFASLILSQCIPFSSAGDSAKERVRACWMKLPWLADQTIDDYEQAQDKRSRLLGDHRASLEELVNAGDISAQVADQLQVAFTEATYHIWRANAPMTCYLPAPGPDYIPSSSSQLAIQAEILAELSDKSGYNPDTIAQAQAAIERDITFLNLSEEKIQALYSKLMEDAGSAPNYPTFDDLELEVAPEAIEAARFLVELILDTNPVMEETR